MPTHTDSTREDEQSPTDPVATSVALADETEYDELVERFGAAELTDEQVVRFPDHPLLRRRVYYAGRDVERYLDAATRGEPHSIVTGIGPSGPMHLGHVMPFYLAKRLQEATGATVYVPLSDDEKYLAREQTMAETATYTRENLRDLLAVGFDPDRTRFVVDTRDADVVYPTAVAFAKHLTYATVEAVYGEPANAGLAFYPAVQTAHLLLPQLVSGPHPTLVPIAVDQDPHVRVSRDVAAKQRFPVEKPAALLGKFLPGLSGPQKMSSSDDAPAIDLTDDRETVFETVRTHAYSGGRESVEAHREHGGDPAVDVAFQYLAAFLEPDDAELARIEREYRSGDLLSGELKDLAAERIADFLAAHQARRNVLGDLEDELAPFRLTEDERQRALASVGLE